MDAVVLQGVRQGRVRSSRVVLIPLRWGQVVQSDLRGDGGYKARHTGESAE
jgi:hypothetical protein